MSVGSISPSPRPNAFIAASLAAHRAASRDADPPQCASSLGVQHSLWKDEPPVESIAATVEILTMSTPTPGGECTIQRPPRAVAIRFATPDLP